MIQTLEMTGPPPTQFSPGGTVREAPAHRRKAIRSVSRQVEIKLSGIKTASAQLKRSSQNTSHVVFLSLRLIPDQEIPVKLTNIPFEVSGDPRGEIGLDSTAQNTSWRFRIRSNAATKQVSLNFKLDYAGLSTHEALQGVRFYKFLASGGKLQVSGHHPLTGQESTLFTAGIPAGSYQAPDPRLIHIIERLSFIERRCDVSFTIPPDDITAADANLIESTARIIESGHGEYVAQPWTSVSNVEQAQKALETMADARPTEMGIYFEGQQVIILGKPVNLGPVALFTKTHITPEDLQDLKRQLENATPEHPISIRLTPFAESPVEARYLRWLPEDEAKAMEQLPFYRRDEQSVANATQRLPSVTVARAVSLLKSWYDEDAEEQKQSWDNLKIALDRDRLSDRKLFS